MKKYIAVPAKPGDIVLLTPGALGGGSIHWWQFEIDFKRPDGSRATSNWLIAKDKYSKKHGSDPLKFQVIGDIVWQSQFTGLGGDIDQDAILVFAESEEEAGRNVTFDPYAFGFIPPTSAKRRMNPVMKKGYMIVERKRRGGGVEYSIERSEGIDGQYSTRAAAQKELAARGHSESPDPFDDPSIVGPNLRVIKGGLAKEDNQEKLVWRRYKIDPETDYYAEAGTEAAAFQIRHIIQQHKYRLRANTGSGFYVVGMFNSIEEAKAEAQRQHSSRFLSLNPLTRGQGVAVGLGLLIGIGAAIYYATRPAAASAPAPTLPPGSTPQTRNVAVVGGQTVQVNVGDTLNVQLLLPSGVASYTAQISGAAVLQNTGPVTNPSIDTASIPFFVSAAGTEQITAVPMDSNYNPTTVAPNVIFTVQASPPPVV